MFDLGLFYLCVFFLSFVYAGRGSFSLNLGIHTNGQIGLFRSSKQLVVCVCLRFAEVVTTRYRQAKVHEAAQI